jgi:hypothetical protein
MMHKGAVKPTAEHHAKTGAAPPVAHRDVMARDGLLELQRTAGNRAVNQLLGHLGIGRNPGTGTVSPTVHEVLRSPGQSLDITTRGVMEHRFGHDFDDIRVHTGARAAESARAVGARAYTVGRHVVFGAGHYAPGTMQGRRLLAHELVHTIQQGRRGIERASNHVLTTGEPGDIAERQAEAVANRVAARTDIPGSETVMRRPVLIQRHVDPDLFLRGENYWFPNQGQARMAALLRATQLGPDHTISHHPSPAVGQPHYHIVNPRGAQVSGHFFYGRRPPIKEREQGRYRERARERSPALERTGIAAAIGAGFGIVIGGIIGGVGGGAGGTLVAPGVGTVGGAIGGGALGAAKGAAIGGLVGGAIGGGVQALWEWATD